MDWVFDQAPNAACIVSASVCQGDPVLVVSHYEDDRSWAFCDGKLLNAEKAMVVAMSTVLNLHPELVILADLPPGFSATRPNACSPWVRAEN
jgi:hypothetical protein